MKIYDEFEIDISDKVLMVKPDLINLEVKPTDEEQIFKHEGVDGYDEVKVEAISLQEKEVNPAIVEQEVIADEEYVALKKVKVNPVTNTIDGNIVPENIRRGVNILGITGDLETVKPGQEKTVVPTKGEQIVVPDEGFELHKVVVEAIPLQVKEVEPSTDAIEVVPDDESLVLEKVIVKPVQLETKEVVPKEEPIEVVPEDESCLGLERVIVNPIPEEYIIPEGQIEVTENKVVDVTKYQEVMVNVNPSLQAKVIEVGTNETKEVYPDEGFYGLINVQVSNNQELEQKEITPTKEVQNILPSEGKLIDGITVNPIPDEYIVPSGEMEITENGVHDVKDKESINVHVAADVSEYLDDTLITNLTGNGNSGFWRKLVKKLKVSKVEAQMSNFFCGFLGEAIEGVEDIDITANSSTKSLQQTFGNCEALISLDLSKWDTKNITTMSSMFNGCYALESLDVSNWNTSKVNSMGSMFYNCKKLKSLNVKHFNVSQCKSSTSLSSMFSNCSSLESLDLNGWDTTYAMSLSYIFSGCNSLKNLDISTIKTDTANNLAGMFKDCKALESLDLKHFNTKVATSMNSMFYNCTNLKTLDISNFDTSNVTSMSEMFYGCSSLTSLDLSHFNVGKITSLGNFFKGCTALKEVNLSGWTSNIITSMREMFIDDSNLETVNISNWNMSGSCEMSRMFDGCKSLKNFICTGANMTNMTGVSMLFRSCESLEEIDLSGWDTSKVTSMEQVFQSCPNLKRINLAGWTFGSNVSFYQTFNGCSSLEFLDIRDLDFTGKTINTNVFGSVPNDCLIIVKDETSKNVILSVMTKFTNVKTVAEYEAQ